MISLLCKGRIQLRLCVRECALVAAIAACVCVCVCVWSAASGALLVDIASGCHYHLYEIELQQGNVEMIIVAPINKLVK